MKLPKNWWPEVRGEDLPMLVNRDGLPPVSMEEGWEWLKEMLYTFEEEVIEMRKREQEEIDRLWGVK